MKTKTIFAIAFLITGLFASCSQGEKKQEKETSADNTKIELKGVTVNPEKSVVFWEGEMLGVYKHSGTLKLTESELSFSEGKISGGSFMVNMASMVPTDENYNPEEGKTKEKLVEHLSSPDFFDVENFPTAKFQITSVEGNTAKGMLTIRGNTDEEIVENIEITKDGNMTKITGDLVFDRKKYDVSWDSPMKDVVLSNDIKVKIELVGS